MAGVMTVVIELPRNFLKREGFLQVESESVSGTCEVVSQQWGPIAKGSAAHSWDDIVLSASPGMMELGL